MTNGFLVKRSKSFFGGGSGFAAGSAGQAGGGGEAGTTSLPFTWFATLKTPQEPNRFCNGRNTVYK